MAIPLSIGPKEQYAETVVSNRTYLTVVDANKARGELTNSKRLCFVLPVIAAQNAPNGDSLCSVAQTEQCPSALKF